MKLPLLSLLAVSALLALVPAGCTRKEAPKADAVEAILLGERDVVTVRTGTIDPGVRVTGTLVPAAQVEVKPRLSGQVETVVASAVLGAAVEKDQALVHLDSRTYQAQLAGAESRVAAAERDVSAQQMLFSAGAVAEKDLVNARSSLQAAKAELATARANLAATVVTSPLAGTVTQRKVETGEAVASGQTLFTVSDLSALQLVAQVRPSQLPRIRVGQRVSITFELQGKLKADGTVHYIERIAATDTRLVGVRIRIPNPNGTLVGGLFAQGLIETGESQPLPLVPLTAIRKDASGSVVFVVDGGKLRRQPVTTGREDGSAGVVEVLSGLAEGAKILAAPNEQARDGAPVTTAPVAKAPASGGA